MILSENYTVLHFEGDTMKWWEVLKNAKISGKATGKGKSFDASKIKINIDKDDCIRRMKDMLQSANTTFREGGTMHYGKGYGLNMESEEFKNRIYRFIENVGEPTICKILRFIDSYDLQGSFKKYLDMSQKELKKVSDGDNKWKTTSRKNTDIDGYSVSLFLEAGKVDYREEIDIVFICIIGNSDADLYFNEWNTMELNPNKMRTTHDWRE